MRGSWIGAAVQYHGCWPSSKCSAENSCTGRLPPPARCRWRWCRRGPRSSSAPSANPRASARRSTRAAPSRHRMMPSASVTTIRNREASATEVSTARSSSTTRESGEARRRALDLGPGQRVAGVGAGPGPGRATAPATTTARPGRGACRGLGAAHHGVVHPLQLPGVLAQVGAGCHGVARVRRHRRLLPTPGGRGGVPVRVAPASRGGTRATGASRHPRGRATSCNPSRAAGRSGCAGPVRGSTTSRRSQKERAMTETLERPAADAASAPERADAWLSRLRGGPDAPATSTAAAGMFAAQSFWRDLVSFTWNLTTVEDPEGVADLLDRDPRDAPTRPASRPSEPPDEADGVVTAWFTFETAVGRGTGLLRLEGGGRRRQGVDVPHHALRAEGPRGAARHRAGRWAPSTAPTRTARPGRSAARRRPRASAATTQPYVLVIGGGQGGIAPRRPAAPARRAEPRHRQAPAARRPVAQPLQVALPARPGLVRPPALPEVPRQLAGLRAQGQDRRLARVVRRRSWRCPTGRARRRRSATWSEETGEWTVEVEREGQPLTLRPKQLVFATGMSRQAAHPGRRRHSTSSAATSTTPRRTRGRTPTAARRRSSSAATTRAFDICGALWENDVDVTMVQRSLDAHRQERQPDGHRPRRPLLRAGGRGRGDHREGRPDLRVAALPDPARVPDPGLRGDGRAATRTSTTGSRRPASGSTGATTAPGCS